MWKYSASLPDEFFSAFVSMCDRLECSPVDMASCWMSESGLSPSAHNSGGNASGLFQAMPSTLLLLGYHGKWDQFIQLSALDQLPWAEKYYRNRRGQLVSAGACYLATFMPALMAHANEPTFVICGRHGPYGYAYAGNYAAFDPMDKGYITVSDLSDRISRVATGPRWQEISARIALAMQSKDTRRDIQVPTGYMLKPEEWQAALTTLGFPCQADGIWGVESMAACVAFQASHGLVADGICGPVTRSAMAGALLAANAAQ